MNRLKIFICGNFGYKNNQIDGQTVKTRKLKDILIKKLGENNIAGVDTSYAKSTPFATFNKIKRNAMNCSHLIILPGKNGLKVLLPFYILWKRNYNIDIRYIVIGGWFPQFLYRNRFYLGLCKKIDGIYVETNIIKKNLLNMGLNNVSILPNFRQIDFAITKINKIKLPFKLVYFSRVVREKGVELAIEAVERINRKNNFLILDIYGPIQKNYRGLFEKILAKAKSKISYKGILEPKGNTIYKVLSKYDLMVFPTYYQGEGFPGAILDSYISGVPVITSDWRYNSEIIKEGETGKLFISQDIDDLTDKLEFLINNPDLIYKMKKNCLEEAKKYNDDFIVDILEKKAVQLQINQGELSMYPSQIKDKSDGVNSYTLMNDRIPNAKCTGRKEC
jgi:glycosyltransferase involved in cell wall biosynthesis